MEESILKTRQKRIHLDDATKRTIKIKLNIGHEPTALANEYGVSKSVISVIRMNAML